MHEIHVIWHNIYHLPWKVLGTYLLTSGIVASIFQIFKKHITIKDKAIAERGKALIVPLAGVFSAVPTYVNYLVSDQGKAWLHVVPKEFAFIFSGATVLHALLISPGYAKLATSLAPWVKAAKQIKAEAVAQPVTSSATTTALPDFNPDEPTTTPPLVGAQ